VHGRNKIVNANSKKVSSLLNNVFCVSLTRASKIAVRHHIAEAQRKRDARKDRTFNIYMPCYDHICPTVSNNLFLCLRMLFSELDSQRRATKHIRTVVLVVRDERPLVS
jgi:hypothetical protein